MTKELKQEIILLREHLDSLRDRYLESEKILSRGLMRHSESIEEVVMLSRAIIDTMDAETRNDAQRKFEYFVSCSNADKEYFKRTFCKKRECSH